MDWKELTTLVAFIAALVALGNLWVAREKFRLDLFDRRFKIFEGARRLISHAVQTGGVEQTALWEFRAAVIEKEFLFSDGIVEYLNEMDQHAVRAYTQGIAEKQRVGEAPNAEVAVQWQAGREANEVAMTWLLEQLQQLHARFAPDMRIRSKGLL